MIYNFIKEVEGCKLTAYQDSVGVWTIGYGHTKNVKRGDVITQQQANVFLDQDLKPCYECLFKNVKVFINEHQKTALLSFIFNVGVGAFEKSTLLKKLNNKEYDEVPKELMRWIYATVNNKKMIVEGLKNRRAKEVKMWELETSQ